MIHGIDSYKLLVEVNKQAQKCQAVSFHACYKSISPKKRPSSVSALMNVGKMLQKGDWKELHHIQISGVMGMATNIDDTETKLRKNFVP